MIMSVPMESPAQKAALAFSQMYLPSSPFLIWALVRAAEARIRMEVVFMVGIMYERVRQEQVTSHET
jgi:hypothetical protein